EEFESEAKTRSLPGFWGRVVTVLSVGTTLFALYYAAAGAEIPGTRFVLVPNFRIGGQTITTPQIYVMLFLSAILVLTFLAYPAGPRFLRRVNPIDLVLCVAAVAITAYVLLNFNQVIYRVNTPTPTDFAFGVVALLLILEAARRSIGWHLPVLGIVAILYAYFA